MTINNNIYWLDIKIKKLKIFKNKYLFYIIIKMKINNNIYLYNKKMKINNNIQSWNIVT